MLSLESVNSPSPASRAGFRKYDSLISCNGQILHDWLDFVSSSSEISIEVEFFRGYRRAARRIRRLPGEEWGFVFRGQSPRTCRRKCIFCFVDQMPPGVRGSLRVKDDDIRYSFTQGTYVTLNHGDARYAISKRLSPVHVSVHATDPELRGRLLGTGRSEPVLPELMMMSDAGIDIETQIVVVPEYNDGDSLDRSIGQLLEIPGVKTIGVVPVGLTRYREGLTPLRRPTGSEAREIIKQCDLWRARSTAARGEACVFPSDEFFVMADYSIPPLEYYQDFTLLENGIGMLSRLLYMGRPELLGEGTVCTGRMAAPFLETILAGSGYRVLAVENRYFGDCVRVAGLLTGEDVVRAVAHSGILRGRLILPSVMFNHRMQTLDDMLPEDIGRLTGLEIAVAEKVSELE